MNKNTFKISRIIQDADDEFQLVFSNGKRLTYYHGQDCCEWVYAAFNEIDDLAYDYEFEEPLLFESVQGYGFRFGNSGRMVSVPCYNRQNGWYSDDLEILYDNVIVIKDCDKKDEIY